MGAKRLRTLPALLLLLGLCRFAAAHPMGNFSVNHYSKIIVQNDRIRIRYFIDLAEIPTYQELQQANIAITAIDPRSLAVINYIASRGAELGRGLTLNLNGTSAPLRLISSGVIFPPGAGGLPTMKMGFLYEAAYPTAPSTLEQRHISLDYADNNYPGHTGWKEIIALAPNGQLLRSSVPGIDRSGELSNYPTDLVTSPPQALEASLVATLPPFPTIASNTELLRSLRPIASSAGVKPAPVRGKAKSGTSPSRVVIASVATSLGPSPLRSAALSLVVDLKGNQQQTPRSRFTELIESQHLSAWFLFTAALIAIGLGGLHALEPGHGKTVVAAYLVGSRGTGRHAVLLGMIVTLSHTAGVFALGAVTLYASRYIVPEQLYPWLGLLSGITIAGLGCYMLLRRLTGMAADHSHRPGSSHGQWMFWKHPAAAPSISSLLESQESPAESVSLTQLLSLGITGGIVPCPAALVVLLSAFALHRIGLGFFLILAFSVGLAAVLIGFGVLMVYARRFIARLKIEGPLTKRWLPVASSAFITVLGLILAIQALSSAQLNLHLPSNEQLGPILFVTGLGLILGMRHSTDADHVVAISTLVTKQRTFHSAAIIGTIWGIGHTITIFFVGSLIILFGVEIPPRLGLSMEFSVAVMLILLGILNLTGVMQRIAAWLTPTIAAPGNSIEQKQNRKRRVERFLEDSVGRIGIYQCLRPLVIGLVHGLAGSAAVALLVLSTIHTPVWATIYLLIFGVGTMIGMMCMTTAIAVPLRYAGDRFGKLSQYLGTASGMASLVFGSFLVYQLGFLGGLFTSHPQWTPK